MIKDGYFFVGQIRLFPKNGPLQIFIQYCLQVVSYFSHVVRVWGMEYYLNTTYVVKNHASLVHVYFLLIRILVYL